MQNTQSETKNSQLLLALREAVGLIQMIVFKAIRNEISSTSAAREPKEISMLTGAIVNEIFGTRNTQEPYESFRKKNWGEIEQALLSIKEKHSFLCRHITDALRIQTLCDQQEGSDSSTTLTRAQELGYLIEDRDIPLPSTFMTLVRELGKQHNLVIPPLQITPEQDQSLIH